MKSMGLPGSAAYITAVLEELGVSNKDAVTMLGARPSYYAQMEILTKKLYQNPFLYQPLR